MYYEIKNILGMWIVFSCEYKSENEEVKILFENLTEKQAKKIRAALRKSYQAGKKHQKLEIAANLSK